MFEKIRVLHPLFGSSAINA